MKTSMNRIVSLLVVFLLSVTSLLAANIPAGTRLYLKPNSNWKADNARFAAYFYNGSTNTWESMTGFCDGLYEVVAPQGTWTNVVFCRMTPSDAANNWNNKWDQTGDLTFDGSKNLFTVPEGAWGGSVDQDNWSVYKGDYFITGNGSVGVWCSGKEWEPGICDNKLSDGKITFLSLPAGEYKFKITEGTWTSSYGYHSNFDSSLKGYKNDFVTYTNDGDDNIVIQTSACTNITVTFDVSTKQISVTTENLERYVLMGVGNDWETGIALQPNQENTKQLVLLGQAIKRASDAVQIVHKSPCSDDIFFNTVTLETLVPYSYKGNDIVLEDGVYNFYFTPTEQHPKIYIAGNVENLTTVYLDPKVYNGTDDTWESDEARFAVYYFNSQTDVGGWVNATKRDGLYVAQFPSQYDTYIWCRMNPNTGYNLFEDDKCWNQTADIVLDPSKPLTRLTLFDKNKIAEGTGDGYYQVSYVPVDCEFAATDETVEVHINQFVESDPCNYVFNSFEQAWMVLKQNPQICRVTPTLKGDVIELLKPMQMLVAYGNEFYKGTSKVGASGGNVRNADVILFSNINPNGGKSLVVRTADASGNRAVLVHPVIRNSRNITFDNLSIIGDELTKDNALDIDAGDDWNTMEELANLARPAEESPSSNITLQNCYLEAYGANAIHVAGVKGIHIENNEFYAKYHYAGNAEEDAWAVDWGGTIKFVNCTDIKYLRNNSEGTLATSLFMQDCKRMLVMNNVFWNDNAVDFTNLAQTGRTVANVRLVTYGAKSDNFMQNIGIYYNTFYCNENQIGNDKYHKFDFFRLGGLKQLVTASNKEVFDASTIRFYFNNCYSDDNDLEGNHKYDRSKDANADVNAKLFYLQGIGEDTNWCQCFMYNNFWGYHGSDVQDKKHSDFEVGNFCLTIDKANPIDTYNAFINVQEQACWAKPGDPSSLVIKGSGLNIGTALTQEMDKSGLRADTIYTDRLNADNGVNSIRPHSAVDNSNESLTPYDKIYIEPGTINLFTSPIVDKQITDVQVTSVKLSNGPVNLSIECDNDAIKQYFTITSSGNDEDVIDHLTIDGIQLTNQPVYVSFKRPTKNGDGTGGLLDHDATYEVFLVIIPENIDEEHLVLRIPIRGHYIANIEEIGGAWTVGAFQQRSEKPVETIIWNGTASTQWDDRSNWYKEDGTMVTCLDALTENLTVIIPRKDSDKYVTPPEGITQYPSLPNIKTLDDFRDTRTALWHGEQVNAGSNTSETTSKVANKIYMEYGASLVGVEELNSGGVSRYNEVEQEFIARRNTWLLAGAVVRPWLTDENGEPVVEGGKKQTRLAVSGDYYKWHLPQVYMHEALIDSETGDATWGVEFPNLNVPLPANEAYAIHIPNEYGAYYLPASSYNYTYGTNYDPTEPMRYTFTGRFYNESALPSYDVVPSVPVILSNTYPANIDAQKLVDSGKGTVLIYSYDDESFVSIGSDNLNPVIQAQHGFVFTPNETLEQLNIEREWLLNTEVTHRSAEVEMPYVRIEVRNQAKKVASNVYISIDPAKDDVPNFAVDAPKVFAAETYGLADLYVKRYDAKWASVRVPYANQPIPLGVKVRQKNQTFTFGLVGTNMAGQLLLEDRLAGTVTDLSVNTYSVSDLAVDNNGVCEGRFYLQFVPSQTEEDVPTSIEETVIDDHQITIYACHNNVTISTNLGNNLQTVIVSDMVGRYQVYKVSGRYVTLSLPVVSGIYTIHVVADNAVRTEKIYLSK